MSTKSQKVLAQFIILVLGVLIGGFSIWRIHYYYVVVPRELQEVRTELASMRKKMEELENDPIFQGALRSAREEKMAIETLHGKATLFEGQFDAAGLGVQRRTPIVTEGQIQRQRREQQKKEDAETTKGGSPK